MPSRTGRGSRRCSTPSARSRAPRSRAGLIAGEAAAAVAAACDASLYDPAELAVQGRAGRQPGRAARPRAPREGRRAARGRRPPRRDEPGHRRLRRDARRAARARARRRRARAARRTNARSSRDRAPPHADGRTHAAAAGGADDVRLQGGRLAGRPRRGGSPARRRRGVAAGSARRCGRDARGARRPTGRTCCGSTPRSSASASRSLPWHTIRTPIAELAGALAGAAGAAAKIGGDIVLLAQTEVGEVPRA